MQASATEQRIPLAVQRENEEESPFEVRVELEAAAGAGATWMARATRSNGKDDAGEVAPAPSPTGDDVWAQFASSDAAGFFELNFASGETYYSPAWKRLLGYGDEDLANSYDTWLKLIHPEDSGAAPDQVGRHTRSNHRSFAVEFRMKHRRAHWVWIHCVGVQHFSSDGELERVIGFHLDVSERKEVEEQGIEAEERLNLLSHDGGLALFDLDFMSGRATVSKAWRDLIGDPVEHPDLGNFTHHLKDCGGDVTGFLANFGDSDDSWNLAPTTLLRSDRQDVPVLIGLNRQSSRRGELLRVVGFALPLPDQVSTSSTA